MGLDVSMTNTGIALLGPTIHTTNVRTYKAKDHKLGKSRAKPVIDTIRALAQEYEVLHMFIEGPSYGSKGSSAWELAEFSGIVKYHITSIRRPLVQIPPTQVKKMVTGCGNAAKEKVLLCIQEKYDMIFPTDHESDALAVALTGRVLENHEKILW